VGEQGLPQRGPLDTDRFVGPHGIMTRDVPLWRPR
jgi:hypothetical protein